MTQTINPSTPSLFKAKLSPYARGSKNKPDDSDEVEFELMPKKLEWKLSADLRAGVRYAETRISDLICQNDSQALEFRGYGGNFIKRHGFSPDAFVQMAFQAAYYSLYGEFAISITLRMRRPRGKHIRASHDQSLLAWSYRGDSDSTARERQLRQGE